MIGARRHAVSGRHSRSVLDASAVLAVLNGEPGQNKVRNLIAQSVMSSVNLGEVLAKLISKGIPVLEAVAAFDASHIEIIPFDRAHAVRSGDYVRRACR
jgi:PIN domain nuclease of toxin-antitoxin system